MSDLKENFAGFDEASDSELQLELAYVEFQNLEDEELNLQVSYAEFNEVYDRPLNLQVSFIEVQSIASIADNPWLNLDEDSDMSTAKFPELIGLTWDIKRRPIFSTAIATSIGGKETRTSFWEDPKWEWDLSYDYLPNYNKNNSHLDQILGFFIERRGAFQSFLYKFQEDYHIEGQVLGIGDGLTSEFPFVRTIGPYTGPVDYVDYDDSPPLVWNTTKLTSTVVSTHIAGHANIAAISQVKFVGGAILTQVPSAPASDQYSVNLATGQFTFNAAQNGASIEISYRFLLQSSEYQLIVPNMLVLDATPTIGSIISSTFDYFWNVRFKEDQSEYNLFFENLWELQEITLLSVPV